MKTKNYYLSVGIVFLLVAFAHLIRFLLGWSVFIQGWEFPMWTSVVAIIVAGYLAIRSFQLVGKAK